MYKPQIIEAIQQQKMLKIQFQKETDQDWVTRKVAPYDVFPKQNKSSYLERYMILGVAERDYEKDEHPVSIYLDTIQHLEVLDEIFDGQRVRRIISPKKPPYVSRSW